MNGHDRSTNINEKKKKKRKTQGEIKTPPLFPICSHIYIYIHMAMYIYICIYTETDPPERKGGVADSLAGRTFRNRSAIYRSDNAKTRDVGDKKKEDQ